MPVIGHLQTVETAVLARGRMGFSVRYWKGSFRTVVRFETEAEALWRALELFEDKTVWDLMLCDEAGQAQVYLSDFQAVARARRARYFARANPARRQF
jgi:hypothetical protein